MGEIEAVWEDNKQVMRMFVEDFFKLPDTGMRCVRAHLYVEYLLDRLLEIVLENPDTILEKDRRFQVYDKVILLEALGVFPQFCESTKEAVLELNSARNEAAHTVPLHPEEDKKLEQKIVEEMPIAGAHSDALNKELEGLIDDKNPDLELERAFSIKVLRLLVSLYALIAREKRQRMR